MGEDGGGSPPPVSPTRGPSWMGIESDYSHNNGIMGYVTHGRYF